MDNALHEQATARLEAALAASSVRDPRAAFRAALRALKEDRPESFQDALRYYETVLVPRIAEQDEDPVAAWLAYGRRIAELSGSGRTWRVDPSGRARETHEAPSSPDDGAPAGAAAPASDLLLFVPDRPTAPVVPLSGPAEPTAAQQASLDLLVFGRLGR